MSEQKKLDAGGSGDSGMDAQTMDCTAQTDECSGQETLDVPDTVRSAVIIFGDPAIVECQRRNWPVAFQSLFYSADLKKLEPEGIDIHIFTSVNPTPSMPRFPYHLQHGGSFGERLAQAVAQIGKLGYEKVVIVGSDCPLLTLDDIRLAFLYLDSRRLVLGPDHQGGCYLIGLRTWDLALIADVHWQRNTDFVELFERAGETQAALLAVRQDLDTLADLLLLATSSGDSNSLAIDLLSLLRSAFQTDDHAIRHMEEDLLRNSSAFPFPPNITRRQ
ncbi:MAG: DUF2064 domain-containing protein [Acidobacteriota bacterium]|nr:DUF2064 domain-containing protein [Acidobacteriota bacterium]